MNLTKTRKIAQVLILSAVRARRRNSNPVVEAKSRLINNKIAAVGFPLITIATYLIFYRGGLPLELISSALSQAFVFLPVFSLFLMVVNGLIFEITLSEYNTSTDIINWLPLRASEYVVGSTISSIYFSLPFLMVFYGVTLGASAYVGQLLIWVATLMVSLMAILIGGFFIEFVRAFMNEASSVISKRGGRFSQVLQLVSTVSIIAVLALFFNYKVLIKVMEWFGFTLEQVWFIPIMWPSMIIQSLINQNITNSTLYTVGSLALMVASYSLGSYAREKYWVPKPITMSIGSSVKVRDRKTGSLVARPEQVIASKDLKALFRKKEMMTLLAIPLMLFLLNFINMDVSVLWDDAARAADRLGVFILPGMGLFMMSLYVSMVSIGQEGRGFMNLQISPVTPRQIILGKASVGWMVSAIILVGMLAVECYFIRIPMDAFFAVCVIGVATITEACCLGLMVGSMFPDFTEVPRARFISSGGVIGILGSGMVVLVTIAPGLLNHFVWSNNLSFWMTGLITLVLAGVVCLLSISIAERKLKELLLMN